MILHKHNTQTQHTNTYKMHVRTFFVIILNRGIHRCGLSVFKHISTEPTLSYWWVVWFGRPCWGQANWFKPNILQDGLVHVVQSIFKMRKMYLQRFCCNLKKMLLFSFLTFSTFFLFTKKRKHVMQKEKKKK